MKVAISFRVQTIFLNFRLRNYRYMLMSHMGAHIDIENYVESAGIFITVDTIP